MIFDWLQETSFPSQALGRTILGPSKKVQGFTRKDLQGFIAEHYHPERMILSAAGGIDHEEIVKLSEASFGTLSSNAKSEKFEVAKFIGGEYPTINY